MANPNGSLIVFIYSVFISGVLKATSRVMAFSGKATAHLSCQCRPEVKMQ
jgi:hypothetical protein